MIVVQVQDDRVERQPLVAPFRAAAPDVLEAIEQAIEPGPDRAGFLRQRVGAFVRRAERARATLGGKVLAERLAGPALRTFGDGVCQLDLIRAQDLMHPSPPRRILRLASRGRICPKTDGVWRPRSCTRTLLWEQAAGGPAAS